VARLRDAGIHVSLFIDPDAASIEAAHALGVPAIELHTGRYAESWRDAGGTALRELQDGARRAAELGLRVHAGHGLDYENVGPVAGIATIEELNIGHAVVARAVLTGIRSATAEMARLVHAASR
jgi:pyridoxine 5-phosphate synthase